MYLFIINNQSGKGMKVWKKTLPLLAQMQINFKSYFISNPDDIQQLELEIHCINTKAVVIIGGDGTIHHTLRFLKNTSIPLGIIPAGSGNDFARALNIPKNCHDALLKILAGKTDEIDLIEVNNKPCATVVGVGFDATVADITNKSKVKKWLNNLKLGNFAYVFGVLRSVFLYKPKNMTINIDGLEQKFTNVWLIALANTPYYGGGLKILPEANKKDGVLNICIVHSLSKLEILMFFPLVFLGKHTLHPCVITATGQIIHISSSDPAKVQGDGEVFENTPISVQVKKKALTVII